MRLSEAIRLGSMMKPQGFGTGAVFATVEASCALGAAADAAGIMEMRYAGAVDKWPFLSAVDQCPACSERTRRVDLTWHLNDVHRWSREQIADWVQTVEARLPETATDDRDLRVLPAAGQPVTV